MSPGVTNVLCSCSVAVTSNESNECAWFCGCAERQAGVMATSDCAFAVAPRAAATAATAAAIGLRRCRLGMRLGRWGVAVLLAGTSEGRTRRESRAAVVLNAPTHAYFT